MAGEVKERLSSLPVPREVMRPLQGIEPLRDQERLAAETLNEQDQHWVEAKSLSASDIKPRLR